MKKQKHNFWSRFRMYTKISELHCYKYINRKGISTKERLFWIAAIVVSLLLVIFMIRISWIETTAYTTSTMIENVQYPVSVLPYPAVTLCNLNMISKKKAFDKANSMKLPENMTVQDMMLSFRGLVKLITFQEDIEPRDLLLHKILETNNIRAHKLLEELAPDIGQFLRHCSWNIDACNCSSMFSPIWTSRGVCYSFNYRGESIDRSKKASNHTLRSSGCSTLSALTVLVDTQIDDYWATIWPLQGVQVKVHESSSVADDSAVIRTVQAGVHVNINMLPATTYASKYAKGLSIADRGCVLPGEENMDGIISLMTCTPWLIVWKHKTYRHNNCIANCRNKIALEICGCVPFHYFKLGTSRACNLTDVACLKLHRGYIMTAKRSFLNHSEALLIDLCGCKGDCEFVQYNIETSFSNLRGNHSVNNADFISDSSHDDNVVIHVAYRDAVATLYRLRTYVRWKQRLVGISGILSVCMGFSVMAAFELMYFFTLRIFFDRYAIPPKKMQKNSLKNRRIQRSFYRTKFIQVTSISEIVDNKYKRKKRD